MVLDEAIKHAEEVAEMNQKVVDTRIVFDDVSIDLLYCDDTEVIEEQLAIYQSRADEYRQLAEWLKDYKRLLEQESSEEISKELKKRVFWEIGMSKEQVAKELGCRTQWGCIQWLWTLDILQKHGFAICRTEGFLND